MRVEFLPPRSRVFMDHSPYFKSNLRNSPSAFSRSVRARAPHAAKGDSTRKSRSDKGAKDQKLVIYGVKWAWFRHGKLFSIRKSSWRRWQPCLAPQGKAKSGARAWSPVEFARGAPLFLLEQSRFWSPSACTRTGSTLKLTFLPLKLEWSHLKALFSYSHIRLTYKMKYWSITIHCTSIP